MWKVLSADSDCFTDYGILTNSGELSGKTSSDAMELITKQALGKRTVTYRLKDWVFSRQRYWGEPIPVIHCETCGVVPVPEKDLPVKLPDVKSYEPTGTGESPLAAITKWVNVKCPTCGRKGKRETNTMPQWAGSSWYYLRYMDPKNTKELVGKKNEAYWSPVDVYVGGAEHATRHLIYARFWHKFLKDIGVVSTDEPFAKLYNVGLIMGEDGRKMSKRFGNVVDPDTIVNQVGADTLRLYEVFMGPFGDSISWSTASVAGARRFIERVWRLSERVVADEKAELPDAAQKALHRTVKKVGDDISEFKFNTAVSSLMVLVNEFEKVPALPKTAFLDLVRLVAPFAPHATEELWREQGNRGSVHSASWPAFDATLASAGSGVLVVQVNGKVRAEFEPSQPENEAAVQKEAQALPAVQKWLEGKTVKKVIFVKGRLVSIVVV
jgi:leucyl-tRNA synthetase